MDITNDIKYVGVDDKEIDLFEGQYSVPAGIAYNSYVILDEKTAVMDSVEKRFADDWLFNIEKVLCDREPDYLVIHHMEPDHSSSISAFTDKYPNATVVASPKAFAMMKNFYGCDYEEQRIAVKEGDTLSLGEHELKFIAAPMVHWPEAMVSYESKTKTLFSADAFGKFGANDVDDDWVSEARRYYIGIVGKYGQQVQALLKKAAALDIERICPLHGPVLKENLGYYIGLYDTWSSYRPEREGVFIAYASIYGNTKDGAELLAEKLSEAGCKDVALMDLARCEMSEAVANAFCYSKIVLAAASYNAGVFPHMREFIEHLTERNFQNRTIALVENGSWAPSAKKTMEKLLEGCKDIRFAETSVKITSALCHTSRDMIEALAKELCARA